LSAIAAEDVEGFGLLEVEVERGRLGREVKRIVSFEASIWKKDVVRTREGAEIGERARLCCKGRHNPLPSEYKALAISLKTI